MSPIIQGFGGEVLAATRRRDRLVQLTSRAGKLDESIPLVYSIAL